MGFFKTKSVRSHETERNNVEIEVCLRESNYFNELESNNTRKTSYCTKIEGEC